MYNENIVKTILNNRGIEDWKQYLNLTSDVLQDYNDLDGMQDALNCFINHYNKKDKILIMPDCDSDGYTSSAMLWLYIKHLDPDYPIDYVMHNNSKIHGIKDINYDKFKDVKLFIVADAATNDAQECNDLIDSGIDIIILDHHDEIYGEESEIKINYQTAKNNNAIIVNNQLSDKYKNKELSGAGIVYRFLQALDDYFWVEYADNYLDLCAVGLIGDMMDIKSFETRYLINEGISNIHNNFLLALSKAQEFSTKGIINIHNVSWYLTPVINAVSRMGSYEERDLMFRAMTNQYEEFDYYKKKEDITISENIYDRAVRLAKNIKSRQDKQRDIVFNELLERVDTNDKVVVLESKKAKHGLIGLSCMKLAEAVKRPVIIVKERDNNGVLMLNGSCRNYNDSPIADLKQIINQTKAFEFCSGHGNAAGLAILPENVSKARNMFNELLKDVDFDEPTKCDFILDINDLDINFIRDIDSIQWLFGHGLKEPKIAIENICVNKDDINLYGKNMDTISFEIDGIKFIKFKCTDGDTLYDYINSWEDTEEEIIINAIVECGLNNYNGIITPQCTIIECEISGAPNEI